MKRVHPVIENLNKVRAVCFGPGTGTTSGAIKGEANRLDVAGEINLCQETLIERDTAIAKRVHFVAHALRSWAEEIENPSNPSNPERIEPKHLRSLADSLYSDDASGQERGEAR